MSDVLRRTTGACEDVAVASWAKWLAGWWDCCLLNMTATSLFLTGVMLHRSPSMGSSCSLCFAPCDLWMIQAHTKTKGTSQQMRYRFFVNVRSVACIIALLWIMLLWRSSPFFMGRILTSGACDLHGDYGMRGSIPAVWQVSCLLMMNKVFCEQICDMWSLKSSPYIHAKVPLNVHNVWYGGTTFSHLHPFTVTCERPLPC